MKIIFGLKKIKKFRKPVVALGVFDGVHRGHINILKSAVAKARRIKGTSVVLTFWPHPQKEESLYSLAHRLKLVGGLGIDAAIVIRFNPAFARISAEDFIKNILIKKIGAEYIYVGKNFRFGKNAKGDFKLLEKLSRVYNFQLKLFAVIRTKHQSVSSTYIRQLIKGGNLQAAQKLLTRPVSVFGTVIKGASLARSLGFPTANINPHHEVLPPSGDT
jgi:riboflavin kinase/FMN adenylyltransferase